MKYFVIADADTVLGFRYVGIRGCEVNSAREARKALDRAVSNSGIGIVIVTESVAESIRDEVNAVRFGRNRPLIVEVPGRTGPLPGKRSLIELIREAVGIHV